MSRQQLGIPVLKTAKAAQRVWATHKKQTQPSLPPCLNTSAGEEKEVPTNPITRHRIATGDGCVVTVAPTISGGPHGSVHHL